MKADIPGAWPSHSAISLGVKRSRSNTSESPRAVKKRRIDCQLLQEDTLSPRQGRIRRLSEAVYENHPLRIQEGSVVRQAHLPTPSSQHTATEVEIPRPRVAAPVVHRPWAPALQSHGCRNATDLAVQRIREHQCDNPTPATYEHTQPRRSWTPKVYLKGGSVTAEHMPDELEQVRRLGSAGQGVVYLMKKKTTSEYVAVKFFWDKSRTPGPKDLTKEAILQLDYLGRHRNIIEVFSAERLQTREVWMQMEYCNGGNLSQQVRRFRSATPGMFVLHVFVQLSEALAFIHHGLRYLGNDQYVKDPDQRALIHSDLKPDNILLRYPNFSSACDLPDIVLCDFGLATLATTPHSAAGTPGWYAPEIIDAFRANDPRRKACSQKADVYTFGLVMFFLMTGIQRTAGRSRDWARLNHLHQLGLNDQIKRCLSVNPKLRPEMSLRLWNSLMEVVNKARSKRDQMFRQYGPLDRTLWKLV
jgi:hypothetical protein